MMKTLLSTILPCAVFAAVLACATPPAQAQTRTQLEQPFETEIRECSSIAPTNFALLPEGHRCELQPMRAEDGITVSLKSSIPCGCHLAKTSSELLAKTPSDLDLKCVAGGPAQITLTSKERTQTVFVGAGQIGFFRADKDGYVSCRAVRWRDVSDLLASFEWPEVRPTSK
jgi:hypothetical protein